MNNNQCILVVDDEETLCEAVKFNLEVEGYNVDTAYSAEEALNLDLSKYSLIILDVMMGAISGFKMAQILKANPQTKSIPIIFCTAKDSEDDMVAGLNIGADDYIYKPYTIRNLLARVKAVLRRSTLSKELPNKIDSQKIIYNSLILDIANKSCMIDGELIDLTKKEFELFVMLISNKNKIFSRGEILSKIWSNEVIVVDRTVDVTITRLRKK
jgi:Response regulators consisting of a CheY-like receiver domain and a winged-helix DNA-binding domain